MYSKLVIMKYECGKDELEYVIINEIASVSQIKEKMWHIRNHPFAIYDDLFNYNNCEVILLTVLRCVTYILPLATSALRTKVFLCGISFLFAGGGSGFIIFCFPLFVREIALSLVFCSFTGKDFLITFGFR